jgi:hypothetical protein
MKIIHSKKLNLVTGIFLLPFSPFLSGDGQVAFPASSARSIRARTGGGGKGVCV